MVGQQTPVNLIQVAQQLIPALDAPQSLVFIKDLQHRYIDCNLNYAKLLGYSDHTQIAGLTDLLLNPNYASLYQQDDERVLNGETLIINNPASFKDLGSSYVHGKILPLKSFDNQINGILGTVQLVYTIADKPFAQIIGLIKPETVSFIVSKNSYIVQTKYGKVKLSKREVQCILLLLKSATAEDIAHGLQLSKRSIESYLVNIKNKLHVNHKGQILEVVICGGLFEQL